MANEKKKDEEELIPTGPGVEMEFQDGEEVPASPEKKEKKEEATEETEGEETEERRAGHEEKEEGDDDENERKSRREERKNRKERQKKARERNQVELNFLLKRNEDLEKRLQNVEGRQSHTEVATIDQRIQHVQSRVDVADQVIAEAIKRANGDDVVAAQKVRDKLRDNLAKLTQLKERISAQAQEEIPEKGEAPLPSPKIDPRILNHAQSWLDDNEWYDPKGGDADSRKAKKIDDAVLKDGYDPRSEDYWEELTDRLKEQMPHVFEKENEDDEEEEKPQKKGKGPRFSANGQERSLRRGEVYVSADRRKAMEEAGVWQDPVLRNKYLKSYAQWDRDNASSAKSN